MWEFRNLINRLFPQGHKVENEFIFLESWSLRGNLFRFLAGSQSGNVEMKVCIAASTDLIHKPV
jgi:hypothetical protein